MDKIIAALRSLRPDQIERVRAYVGLLSDPPVATCCGAGFATDAFAHRFADALRLHHLFSREPFTKDKFEHAMVSALNDTGHKAELAPKNNPGHDLTVDGERWSLKTQADRSIKRAHLHISKFMELGKGKWETKADLVGLRDQMLHHMRSYDRIFSLRCFRTQLGNGVTEYEYELVEIPKSLLQLAAKGDFRLVEESKQHPKPGYCTVTNGKGQILFQLYFDGGTERKLQVKDLGKVSCKVLATWKVRVKE